MGRIVRKGVGVVAGVSGWRREKTEGGVEDARHPPPEAATCHLEWDGVLAGILKLGMRE